MILFLNKDIAFNDVVRDRGHVWSMINKIHTRRWWNDSHMAVLGKQQ
jgi:hypothetical protein